MQDQEKNKQPPPASVTPTGVVANDAEISRFAHIYKSLLAQPPLPTISGMPWLAVRT